MSIHMQIQSPELLRQNEAHKLRRARLGDRPAAFARRMVWHRKLSTADDANAHVAARIEWLGRRDWLRVIRRATGRISVAEIIAVVADSYGISGMDILSQRRTANVVKPRQIAMYLARTLTLRSLPEIGRRFGGRDHSTILHGVRKIEGLIADNPALAAEVKAIRLKLEARST